MSGIDRIYEKIINDAQEQADAKLYEATQKMEFMHALTKERLVQNKQEQLNLAKKEADGIIKRAVSNRNLEGKKQLLSVKQQVISEVFEKAHEAFMNMSDDRLMTLYSNLIRKSLVEGDNEVILNKVDKENFGSDLVASLKCNLEENTRVLLSDQVIQEDKGVIVKNGNIYSNSTFASLLKYKKQELETDIMRITFERSVQA